MSNHVPTWVPKHLIFDVDGVLTDGTFFYSVDGKVLKRFGSHDGQAIKICRAYFNMQIISADKKGFEISNCLHRCFS